MGMVFQQFNLFPHMTILDNITCAPMMLKKVSREQDHPLLTLSPSFSNTPEICPGMGHFFCLESLTTLGCCVCPLLVFSNIFCIFEINSKILSLVAKNIQANLILFHSFIRIFAR